MIHAVLSNTPDGAPHKAHHLSQQQSNMALLHLVANQADSQQYISPHFSSIRWNNQEELKYRSADGDLEGVVGNSWVLKPDPISFSWHSVNRINEGCFPEIVSASCKDVDGLILSPITTTSLYFYGKAIARAIRLALIAEVSFLEVIPTIQKFLRDLIEL
ncbi:hypothetical protein NE237_005962 [Protea cynaroides]|uniref:Uncharacterized protein n=1 Tax=Protea cynaroides TaxID=273540 RepID=A0A9Q0KLG8_9MAGN|nr:hypothetical protein NE237_005962 [Protea cynaroides]